MKSSFTVNLVSKAQSGWTTWSSWSTCNVTCSGGIQSRSRYFLDPAGRIDVSACRGDDKMERVCNTKGCVTQILARVSITRWRGCVTRVLARVNISSNSLPHAHKTLIFILVSGGWSLWSTWTSCSVTCSTGVQSKSRSCSNPAPQNGGAYCLGEGHVSQSCDMSPCPVSGALSPWSSWTPCNTSCSGGTRTRLRPCSNPAPQHGGAACQGEGEETQDCNIHPCPGEAIQRSTLRRCLSGGGLMADGPLGLTDYHISPLLFWLMADGPFGVSDFHISSLILVNGGWSAWSNWTPCSVKCEGGTQSRDRNCTHPSPLNGGDNCVGEGKETRACNDFRCQGHETSEILGRSDGFLQVLYSYLRSVENYLDTNWTKCYRTSNQSWSASTFHSNCDNKGPTVTIVRVGENVFGGYTDRFWDNSRPRYKSSEKSFLFTLFNTEGYKPAKLSLKASPSSVAIDTGSGDGPIFGAGPDLYIGPRAYGQPSSYTRSLTYELPDGCNNRACAVLAGSYKFNPTEVEVFYDANSKWDLKESSILRRKDPKYLHDLLGFLRPVQQTPSSRWEMCYSAKRDGWASLTFHRKCNGKAPNVVIVSVADQYVFGGYSDVPWTRRSKRKSMYRLSLPLRRRYERLFSRVSGYTQASRDVNVFLV
ncbi:uncharacterized protein LOC5504431 [Nematostella vectensis]|nr:uncharacterized protein LOC5504431 [Nematostella vectensis]